VPVVDGPEPVVRRSGWAEPRPLAPPPGQDAIGRLVNAALPHVPGFGHEPQEKPKADKAGDVER
jgi:hypothetical protein